MVVWEEQQYRGDVEAQLAATAVKAVVVRDALVLAITEEGQQHVTVVRLGKREVEVGDIMEEVWVSVIVLECTVVLAFLSEVQEVVEVATLAIFCTIIFQIVGLEAHANATENTLYIIMRTHVGLVVDRVVKMA